MRSGPTAASIAAVRRTTPAVNADGHRLGRLCSRNWSARSQDTTRWPEAGTGCKGARVPGPDDPDAVLAEAGGALADAVAAALPTWVEQSVRRLLVAWRGAPDLATLARAAEAGRRAADEVGPELRRLLAADVDRQWVNPLTLVRRAVRFP